MVEVCGGDAGLVLRPFGELCHFQLDPLRAAFEAALECSTDELRVDLAEVTLLSASAVEFFLEAKAHCRRRGLEFALSNALGLNLRVLQVLGAAELVEVPVSLAPAHAFSAEKW